ncbi:MAG: hypothetical protein CVU42_00515 [Chloroflexi bacterium HGW-Chloroflexi-4]|jgi:hypothetical protein|nr:MAG: hypothetical protein CVU42_00515 [Chloroflexi bacterium HGW-Chloroflexi-4]
MDNFSSSVEPNDRREERHAQSIERREAGTKGLLIGVILVFLGGLFLMRNLGFSFFHIDHWWALFILIPIIGSAQRALFLFKKSDNQMNPHVFGAIFISGVLILVMLGFIFDINLQYFGPALFILAGAGVLIYEMAIKKAA